MATQIRAWRDPKCFRAIALCDPHFAASSPPSFKEPYLDYLTSNIKQVVKHAGKIQADTLLWAGDIFHLKEPRSNPLWLIAKVLGIMFDAEKTHGVPSLGIGGNHDYKHGSLEGGLWSSKAS